MDEKSFLIGICSKQMHVYFKKQIQHKKLLNASQNGFKEFIFLLICICVNGNIFPPVLIYENKSKNFIDL